MIVCGTGHKGLFLGSSDVDINSKHGAKHSWGVHSAVDGNLDVVAKRHVCGHHHEVKCKGSSEEIGSCRWFLPSGVGFWLFLVS